MGEVVEKEKLLGTKWILACFPFCIPSFGLEKAALRVGFFVSLVVLLDIYLIFFPDIPVINSRSQSLGDIYQ